VRQEHQAVWAALALQGAERQLPGQAEQVALSFLQHPAVRSGPVVDLYRLVPWVLHSLEQETSAASVQGAWEAV
jgi:hypothetical protein